MTNKQTIDGVSRKVIEGALAAVSANNDSNWSSHLKEELRAILDKPTVNTDVRTILLEVVPGDGSGHEIYAKSVEDVEKFLSRQGGLIEELELKLYDADQSTAQPQGEVERLREELSLIKNEDLKYRSLLEQEGEIKALRTQLAERDALLASIGERGLTPTLTEDELDLIDALSASVEPKPRGEAVAWNYCPECGSEKLHHEEGEHKQCANCHQEWFSDIDYSEVVRGNLQKLKAEHPAPVAVVLPERRVIDEEASDADQNSDHGYNAALDDVAKLNGIKP